MKYKTLIIVAVFTAGSASLVLAAGYRQSKARPHEVSTVTLTPLEVGGQGDVPVAVCGGVSIINVVGAPPRMISGNFMILTTYEPSIPASWRPVINYAVNEWNQVLQSQGVNPSLYPITFRRIDMGSAGPLAQAVTYWNGSGQLSHTTIEFNSRYYFFVDPTPEDDSDVPFSDGYDLLSTVRHELGHAVGWVGRSNIRIDPLVDGSIFDTSRLNIALHSTDDTSHTNGTVHPGELMQPSIGASTRRSIAMYPTVAMVARAFEYRIPMEFADPSFIGSPDGSAAYPWRSFTEANAAGSSSLPILLAPQEFHVSPQSIFGRNHTLVAARGGATVTSP